jgi:glycosidase
MKAFHVSREARQRYAIDRAFADTRGDLLVRDRPAVRRLAQRMNAARPPGSPPAQPGELAALGMIHEIFHLLIERYEDEVAPDAMDRAVEHLEARLQRDADRVLEGFKTEFPGWEPSPDPADAVLEELLLTRVANENPAATSLRELFDDRPLAAMTPYTVAVAELEEVLGDGPACGPDGESLLEMLRAPARHSPTSLAGQLRYIRDSWRSVLGDALDRVSGELDLTIGVLSEEERALHLRFGGGGAGGGGLGGPVERPEFGGLEVEPERFSSDSAWMPRVVLMAKSTYVWLDQLSRRHGRDIRTLDAVPDEELETLARWGVTGLWLIGLWERSKASERIKRMRGNEHAAASAYSLDDYRIADDLGGEMAYEDLRDRAAARGIRLASDMVPNHMGLDSRWVVEHPEWFLSVPEPPFPSYTFEGPDLSSDPRAGIVLEDHYWDDSDAAVVFKRFGRGGGDQYIYHGNDGTSFPWNDTAQLDFLDPNVREAVIQTILDVARRFPVIRFDAAMVLAKKHIQRLWWPEPGTGGGIPSRAEYALSKEEFDRRMPNEFWREVVDRVAAEVPDTLLLAEAFWLMEGYFVRTLGMHRVYNSAFMHMLRDEDNAGYRKVIKETIEFDREILQRYVNFMNNPDEKTAVEQFGKGDKYFGVATLLATLPGLPMLGHGQVEGFGEKYGMEFRRATLDEQPDPWLVERHEREIFPLLHRRGWFAEAEDFLMYDFATDGGGVDENVFAYSNGRGPTRSLVVYHNRFGSTAGRVRDSVAFALKGPEGTKSSTRRTLADGLGLARSVDDSFLAFRDAASGLEYLRSVREVRDEGLSLRLDAYGRRVFWEFRELPDPAGLWRRLADRLGGSGTPSLDDALRDLHLEPVHTALRALLASDVLEPVLASSGDDEDDGSGETQGAAEIAGDGGPARAPVAADRDETAIAGDTVRALDELEHRHAAFLDAVARSTGTSGDPRAIAVDARRHIERAFRLEPALSREPLPAGGPDRMTLAATLLLAAMGELVGDADPRGTSRAWFDELRLAPVVAEGLRGLGLDEGRAWATVDHIRILLGVPRPSSLDGPEATLPYRLARAWLEDPDARRAIGVNTWEGEEWLDERGLAWLIDWTLVLERVAGIEEASPAWSDLGEVAGRAGWRADRFLTELAPTSASAAAGPEGEAGPEPVAPAADEPSRSGSSD